MKAKSKKEKRVTRASLEKWLARALSLTIGKDSTTIDVIRFDAKKKELAATDGRVLLVVKIKSAGTLLPFNLEDGFYDLLGGTLIKSERDKASRFPNYVNVIPFEKKEICAGDILYKILDCMTKQQVCLDIWKYESTLKTLDKFSSSWVFTNESNTSPVMMEADNEKYNVKYIIMPIKF